MNEISPILIPVIAMLIPIVAIAGGIYSQVQGRRLKADQQMAMIARGIPLAEIEAFQRRTMPEETQPGGRDPVRSLGNARRAAVVLIATGVGLMMFFGVLDIVLNVHQVLAGAAAGLIPLAIGVGFVVDYQMQKREMARFGLEVAGRDE